jgi:hypothetical protein
VICAREGEGTKAQRHGGTKQGGKRRGKWNFGDSLPVARWKGVLEGGEMRRNGGKARSRKGRDKGTRRDKGTKWRRRRELGKWELRSQGSAVLRAGEQDTGRAEDGAVGGVRGSSALSGQGRNGWGGVRRARARRYGPPLLRSGEEAHRRTALQNDDGRPGFLGSPVVKRRGGDSNSRTGQARYWFSKPARSTALPPLREGTSIVGTVGRGVNRGHREPRKVGVCKSGDARLGFRPP